MALTIAWCSVTRCRARRCWDSHCGPGINLRFFAGLTMPEIAQVLKISLATAERHWTYARTWLYAELKDRDDSANS